MKKSTFKFLKFPSLFLCILTAAIFISIKGLTTNYYVSASGKDSNPGTTPDRAWKSVDRVNKLIPKPGDSILFRRGDEWSGIVTVNMWGMEEKPLVYGAYGDGMKPKIYGSEPITGWVKHSGNIYKARFDKVINQLFVDNKKMKAARFPNSGYVFITETDGANSLTAEALDKKINYTGAKWFGRTNYFTAPLLDVVSSRSNTLTLAPASRFPFKKGMGFFLMNKLEFLDQAGEWYYDEAAKTVYLWLPKDISPKDSIIRGSVFTDGILVDGKNHITIRDIHMLQQSGQGIHLKNSDNIVIDNNELSFSDGFGIYCETNNKGFFITNNTIKSVNHYGMFLRISNSHILNNRISKIALLEDIGLTGTGNDNYGGGIYLAGEDGNNVVRNNRLTEIGYNGILFARPKNVIEYNFIKDVGLLKSDMGGIYTSWYQKRAPQGPEGSIVRNNIIINVVGEKYGYTSKRNMGEGIYIDESAVGVIIENNTIAHCSNSGIKLHKTENVTVRNNTILDTRQALYVLKSSGSGKNKITNNLMIAARKSDDYLKRQVHINQSSGNALYNYNNYVNLYESKDAFLDGSVYCNFKKWKSVTRLETNSNVQVLPLTQDEKEILFYNDSMEEKKINLKNKNVKDLNGRKLSGTIILKPFTSVILIGNDSGDLLN